MHFFVHSFGSDFAALIVQDEALELASDCTAVHAVKLLYTVDDLLMLLAQYSIQLFALVLVRKGLLVFGARHAYLLLLSCR